MRFLNIRTILKSWKFSILMFILAMSYILFYSITDYDYINIFFNANSSYVNFVNFVFILFLVFLMIYSNVKSVLNKKTILVYLLIILYSGLQILKFLLEIVFPDNPNHYQGHIISNFDIHSVYINNPKNFTYKLALSIDFAISITLLIFLLLYLIKRNSLKLIQLNTCFYNTFLSYLKKLSNDLKHSISIMLSFIKVYSFDTFSKTNFIYIINFIKIIKCDLKRDRKHHSF